MPELQITQRKYILQKNLQFPQENIAFASDNSSVISHSLFPQ